MSATFAVTEVFGHQPLKLVKGTVTFAGNYTAGGLETCSLAVKGYPFLALPEMYQFRHPAGFVVDFVYPANGKPGSVTIVVRGQTPTSGVADTIALAELVDGNPYPVAIRNTPIPVSILVRSGQ